MRRSHIIWLLMIALTILAVTPTLAAPPLDDPPPDNPAGGSWNMGGDEDGGSEGGGEGGGGGGTGGGTSIVNQIIKHIIYFPVESMRKAVEKILTGIIKNNAQTMAEPFYDILGQTVFSNPGVKSAGSGMWQGVDIFVPTWQLTVKVAIALWPAVLAIMAAVGAKDAVLAADWGLRDFKTVLFAWLLGALASGASLEIADLANRASNAVTDGILNAAISPSIPSHIDANLFVNALMGGATAAFAIGPGGPATMFIGLILVIIAFVLLLSLVFQYVARFALLYILVSLSPIALILGVLPPLRWLQWMWIRGFVLVMLIGPINALLVKMAVVVGQSVLSAGLAEGPIAAVIRMMVVGGVVSVLLAINYALIRAIFGAIATVAANAVQAVRAVQGAVLSAGMAVAGVAAAGAVGAAAGTGAMGGGGSPAAGSGGGLVNLAGGMMKTFGGKKATQAWDSGSQEERKAGAQKFLSTAGGMLRGSRSGMGRALGALATAGGDSVREDAIRGQGRQGGTGGGGGWAQGGVGGEAGSRGGGETRAFDQAAREGEQLLKSHYGSRLPKGADMERVRSLAFGPPRQALKQGQSLTSQAHQAGYRGEGGERRYMAGRAERAAAPAIGRTPVFGPDPGATVASPTSFGARPDVRDFDQGQRMATALKVDPARGADLALMHHGLRSGAVNPEKGHEAAQGFSRSMCELGTSDASAEEIRSQAGKYLDEFGGRAGVPPQRLEAWKARLTSMQPQIGGV